MTFQRCPRCGSNRVRRGYIRTPWWSAIIGRYQMLCNACNWEFIGFAVPGTLSTKSKKRRKSSDKVSSHNFNDQSETISVAETSKLGETSNSIENEIEETAPEDSNESDANESSTNEAVKTQNGNNIQIRRIKNKKRTRKKLKK